jgi:hypothetical protein
LLQGDQQGPVVILPESKRELAGKYYKKGTSAFAQGRFLHPLPKLIAVVVMVKRMLIMWVTLGFLVAVVQILMG